MGWEGIRCVYLFIYVCVMCVCTTNYINHPKPNTKNTPHTHTIPPTQQKHEKSCGKTTQIPQFILEAAEARGEGTRVKVVVAQPRRIAAIGSLYFIYMYVYICMYTYI
jgi:hypothetical protein